MPAGDDTLMAAAGKASSSGVAVNGKLEDMDWARLSATAGEACQVGTLKEGVWFVVRTHSEFARA